MRSFYLDSQKEPSMNSRKLQLQPRLRLLADLVPAGAGLVDVGTDHGYLPVWLLQEGRVARAIATDINPAPLAHARRTAEEYGVYPRMDLRLCAGLDGVAAQEVDTVVIAGMGAETIIGILSAAPWTRASGAYLLLQPMTKAEMLRVWLADNGYTFTGEHLVFDKKTLYPIFCVTGGRRESLTQSEAYGGLLLDDDPLYGQYLDQQIKKLRIRIDGLRRARKTPEDEELTHLEELCAALKSRREGIG